MPGAPISTEPAPPVCNSPTRRRMKARIRISPSSAEPMISARMWAAVEWQRRAAVRPGAARGERAAAGQFAHLAGELADAHARDLGLGVEAVAARDDDVAIEHQPGRGMTLAHAEDRLARLEFTRGSAGETLRSFHLGRVENGKHLLAAVLDQ